MEIGDYVNVYWDSEKEDSSEEIVSFDKEGNPIIRDSDDQVYSTETEDGEVYVIPNWLHCQGKLTVPRFQSLGIFSYNYGINLKTNKLL